MIKTIYSAQLMTDGRWQSFASTVYEINAQDAHGREMTLSAEEAFIDERQAVIEAQKRNMVLDRERAPKVGERVKVTPKLLWKERAQVSQKQCERKEFVGLVVELRDTCALVWNSDVQRADVAFFNEMSRVERENT